jgi:hypothetical protein
MVLAPGIDRYIRANCGEAGGVRRKLHEISNRRIGRSTGGENGNVLGCKEFVNPPETLARFRRTLPLTHAKIIRLLYIRSQPPGHSREAHTSSFDFLEFFFGLRNRATPAWSLGPTIRAGLACGIVKLKLDLAGSRKRPRLVFGQSQFSSLHLQLFPCAF